jgi:hypothetical protein
MTTREDWEAAERIVAEWVEHDQAAVEEFRQALTTSRPPDDSGPKRDPCPVCRAEPGWWCVDGQGNLSLRLHADRSARLVDCPKCQANPQELCRRVSDGQPFAYHRERYLMARKAAPPASAGIPTYEPLAVEDPEAWAQDVMDAVEAARIIDRPVSPLGPPQPPEPWPGELEMARVCWRKHGEPRRVRWQFGRWRPCADCLDDLRQHLIPG